MIKKKLNPFVSAICSILYPGMGQVYNGQLKKGICYLVADYLIFIIIITVHLLSTFSGFITALILIITWFLFVLYDSIFTAVKIKEKEVNRFNRWYIYVLFIIICVIANIPIVSFVQSNDYHIFRIPTSGMEPKLCYNDYIVVNISGNDSLKPGNVIVFKNPYLTKNLLVKRCIAIRGQKVVFNNNSIFIDGKRLENIFISKEDYNSGDTAFSKPITVPEDYCFVLGDYFANSLDSRHFGCIPINSIVGKPLYIFWSDDKNRIGNIIK
jgi:signal peptidase I